MKYNLYTPGLSIDLGKVIIYFFTVRKNKIFKGYVYIVLCILNQRRTGRKMNVFQEKSMVTLNFLNIHYFRLIRFFVAQHFSFLHSIKYLWENHSDVVNAQGIREWKKGNQEQNITKKLYSSPKQIPYGNMYAWK